MRHSTSVLWSPILPFGVPGLRRMFVWTWLETSATYPNRSLVGLQLAVVVWKKSSDISVRWMRTTWRISKRKKGFLFVSSSSVSFLHPAVVDRLTSSVFFAFSLFDLACTQRMSCETTSTIFLSLMHNKWREGARRNFSVQREKKWKIAANQPNKRANQNWSAEFVAMWHVVWILMF